MSGASDGESAKATQNGPPCSACWITIHLVPTGAFRSYRFSRIASRFALLELTVSIGSAIASKGQRFRLCLRHHGAWLWFLGFRVWRRV